MAFQRETLPSNFKSLDLTSRCCLITTSTLQEIQQTTNETTIDTFHLNRTLFGTRSIQDHLNSSIQDCTRTTVTSSSCHSTLSLTIQLLPLSTTGQDSDLTWWMTSCLEINNNSGIHVNNEINNNNNVNNLNKERWNRKSMETPIISTKVQSNLFINVHIDDVNM